MNTLKRATRKPLAQNSIDYIVYSNPEPVRELIYDCGFEVPDDVHTLVKATKELVKREGQQVLPKLLEAHPDRKAILKLNTSTPKNYCHSCANEKYNDEDNFCGACGHSNYSGSGDEDSFLDQFSELSDKEVKSYYDRIRKQSNANPKDQKLASEVQLVWNELRQRKLIEKEQPFEPSAPKKSTLFGREELLLMGVVFMAGYLVGASRLAG